MDAFPTPGTLTNKSRKELKKDIIASFLKRHLPVKRVFENKHEISGTYISLTYKKFRTSKHKKKKKPKPPGKAVKKKVFSLTGEGHSFKSYMPLHHMWTQYMQEVMQTSSLKSDGALQAACLKILKMDLHGCILTVCRSKCPSYVGLRGIVLQETRNMLLLITPQDAIKKVPKMNSVFAFEVKGHIFTIHGNHFKVKSAERSSRKFKSKATVDL